MESAGPLFLTRSLLASASRSGVSCLLVSAPGCSDEDDDGVVRWGGDDEAGGEGGEGEAGQVGGGDR